MKLSNCEKCEFNCGVYSDSVLCNFDGLGMQHKVLNKSGSFANVLHCPKEG